MNKRAAVVSGVLGTLMAGVGIWAVMRERKIATTMNGLGRMRQLRMAQAPVIASYSDGAMRTTMRESAMPIEQRIATIQDLVHKSIQDPQMRKVALQVTSRCPERDKMCEAQAIYHFVKSRVRYTGDVGAIRHPDGSVEGVDLYQSARRTLEIGGGDCDDNSILNATLLALNGLDPILRVVKTRGAPDWEHIYTGFMNGRKFVAVDTTLPGDTSFGIEPNYSKKIDFPA